MQSPADREVEARYPVSLDDPTESMPRLVEIIDAVIGRLKDVTRDLIRPPSRQ